MNSPAGAMIEASKFYPFADRRMFVRNAWYVAGRTADITDAITAARVLGDPLILYRDQAGAVTCLEGACPHRQYPLAHAWKEGEQVRCPYHGLRFAPDGRCTEIPGQHEIPASCALRRYPVVEQWAWVWVWMGDAALADPSLIPGAEVTWLDPAHDAFVAEALPIACRYPLLTENLLDLSHIPFLHQQGRGTGWAAGNDWPAEVLEADPDGRWLRGTRVFPMDAPDLPASAGLSGPCELTLALDYFPPTFFIGKLSYRAAGSDARPELHNVHAFTPVDAHETAYHFASGRNFAPGDAAVTEMYRARYRNVLAEDKVAAELIEPLVDRPGRRPDFVTKADRSALRARRVLQRMINAEG